LKNFEIPPKFEILVFFKKKVLCVEQALKRVPTVWTFNMGISHMHFLLSKSGLCIRISAYFLVQCDAFLLVPHL
jgi:hypothetical protein